MKKVLLAALFAALSLGCAITDYPVIFDSSGATGDGVMDGQYDLAYVRNTSQVATIWDDGSDLLFTLVSQHWTGDQWLKTFNNYDPTGSILFLDQTYCDPTFASSFCAIAVAWNPDLPHGYPHGDQSAGYENVDDPFDYIYNPSCSGARSLSMLAQYTSRYGECGSGFAADKQGLAYEFSLLERVEFMGQEWYHMPIDSSIASLRFTGEDGVVEDMRVFGRYNAYIDDDMRTAIPVTANARYQLRALEQFVQAHGHRIDVNLTYGTFNVSFLANVTTVQNALDRL